MASGANHNAYTLQLGLLNPPPYGPGTLILIVLFFFTLNNDFLSPYDKGGIATVAYNMASWCMVPTILMGVCSYLSSRSIG